MRVTIAGGGIGGLATALSLHAAGITDVVVHEAVPSIRPLGVGINLLPHAVRELTEIGLAGPLAGIGVPTAELAYFNAFGQEIWAEPRGLDAGYHWPQYSVPRGALQMLLLEAVVDRLGAGAVRTSSPVRGAGHDGDLLIAADGIRSTVRAALYPDEGPPPWNGLVLWRGTTRGRPFRTGRSMIMAGDGEQKFVAYPISAPDRNGDVLINWIAERPAEEAASRGDWNRRVDPATFLPHFADWRFDWLDVPGVIEAAGEVFEYPMVDRDPLPRWTFGDVTLLGDAAHAMYPIGSNGASQAILDARVLAHALATGRGAEAYEAERRPPTTAIALANRKMGPEVVMRLARERAPEGFTDVDAVIPLAERTEIAAAYKKTAGFDPALLNERASWSV
ncbi:flavin-dependent oxidoreductase [Actinomadura flavalba]|uniref:flavin-dependent oxidoreductase n=1 Tax=Actinomadura flavalba TaxID=1120938 RepID=UPI00037FA3E7|nr:flavin-dependent oxidoreductase [Actinomadura flavalba]